MTVRHNFPSATPDPNESRDFGCAVMFMLALFVLSFSSGFLLGLVVS